MEKSQDKSFLIKVNFPFKSMDVLHTPLAKLDLWFKMLEGNNWSSVDWYGTWPYHNGLNENLNFGMFLLKKSS